MEMDYQRGIAPAQGQTRVHHPPVGVDDVRLVAPEERLELPDDRRVGQRGVKELPWVVAGAGAMPRWWSISMSTGSPVSRRP
jgi:hypothetical protein